MLALLLAVVLAVSPSAAEDKARKRVTPWETSRFVGRPEPPLPYRAEVAFPNLKLDAPVTLTNAPRTSRLFAVETRKGIVSFPDDTEVDSTDLMLDLKSMHADITNIYGLAFHPEYPAKPFIYVVYVLKHKDPTGTVLSRFTVTAFDPPVADPDSEVVLLRWLAGGHNGNCLKFGPDGYLYSSAGDGTGPNPPDILRAGQDLTNLLSTIIRIDVDNQDDDKPYAIPPDNPFVNTEGARPEIYAFGFRNPWKMSFDRKTGYLWVGDVGWDMWELVFNVKRGGNYGWSIVEGSNPIHPLDEPGPGEIVPPVVQHHHSEARSITGGYVYYGKRNPDLVGRYIYGDYNSGKIWALGYDGTKVNELRELTDTSHQIVGWCETNAGELYYADYQRNNQIFHLVPNNVKDGSDQAANFPRKLTDTGLFDSVANYQVAKGVEAYDVNAQMWEDDCQSVRHLALPGSSQIDNPEKGRWKFPADSVAMRTVTKTIDGVATRIETQVLHRHQNEWRPYSYVWNESQDGATLVPAEGTTIQFGDYEHRVASRVECHICHSKHMKGVLGLRLEQLNMPHHHLLEDWQRRGIFVRDHDESQLSRKAFVDPYNENEDLDTRARSYLHVNCTSCHRFEGGGPSPIRLDFSETLAGTKLINQLPIQGSFQLPDAKIVAAGDPLRSVLYYRLAKVGPGHMPHIGAKQIDERGLRLIYDWIESLPQPTVADWQPTDIENKLQTPHGTLQLAEAMRSTTVSEETKKQIIDAALQSSASHVRDLLEPFYPADKKKKRLGSNFDSNKVLSLTGNAKSGQQIFNMESLQCVKCHAVDDRGGELGPPLDDIGLKYKTAAELLKTIQSPSAKILPDYAMMIVVTTDGETVSGRVFSESGTELKLMSSDRKTHAINHDDIESINESAVSMMPQDLLQSLSAQEAADLIAYLATLQTR